MMKRTRLVSVALALFLPAILVSLGSGCSGCRKDEDDVKPAASAPAPPPTPSTPPAPVAVAPEEDAGVAPPDASVPDAGKPPQGGPGGAAGSIAKCCAALQSNANSAPMDQRPYYMAAANACNGMRNTPSAQQAFAQLRMFLAGAKMPAACK